MTDMEVVSLIFSRLGMIVMESLLLGDKDYGNSGGGCDCEEVVCDP